MNELYVDENLPPNKQHREERRNSLSSASSHTSQRDFSPASDHDPTYIPLESSSSKHLRRSNSSSSSSSSCTTTSSSSSSSSSSCENPSRDNQVPLSATLTDAHICEKSNCIQDCRQTIVTHTLDTNISVSVSRPESSFNPIIEKGNKLCRHNYKRGNNKKKTAQTLRNLGKQYMSSSSKIVGERTMSRPCNEKCRLKCGENITEEDRKKIFDAFWNLGSLVRQRDFIAMNLETVVPKYQYKRLNSNRKPKNAFHFVVNGEKLRVCKIFFKNTLGINDRPIRTVLDKKNEQGIIVGEQRGKHNNKKRISEEALNEVRCHINSIPRIESHYLRKQTSKEFIDGGKTLSELYRDYKAECIEKNIPFVKIHIYRKVFNTEFNISFFVPKKDQCDLCTAYKNADIKQDLEDKYQTHLKEKNESRLEKEKDKKINESIVSCYDLQAVMTVPKGEISVFYYKSKINCFNFTISELRKDHTECYFWTEVEGQRGVNEIGTCVLKYLEKMSSLHPDSDFIFYSDNCCGQQKNQFMFSLYLYALKNLPIKSIIHKFLVKGHTQNEGDAVHSTIEREIKKLLKSGPIYVPDQYIAAIKNARKKGNPYIVNVMSHRDFYDIKLLSDNNLLKNTEGEKIKIGDIKIIKVVKYLDEHFKVKMFYKNSYLEQNFKEIRLETNRIATRRQQSSQNRDQDYNVSYQLKPLYSAKLPLAERKRNDIKSLIEQNLIPKYYASSYFYNII
ncbi:unnamed protein product [Parnassius mnemosyne]|uniref:DUF7869 domain-containing protein n=1 Tax=Parnassius mnemosyne TaxID=213953 RepID=A0AAV1LVR5_9NEOP